MYNIRSLTEPLSFHNYGTVLAQGHRTNPVLRLVDATENDCFRVALIGFPLH